MNTTAKLSVTAISDLERICPGAVVRDVSLASISRWRIGGLADVIVRPRNIEELARLRAWLHEQGLAHVVIGGTTNLLFADEGLRVVCIQIGEGESRINDLRFTGYYGYAVEVARIGLQYKVVCDMLKTQGSGAG